MKQVILEVFYLYLPLYLYLHLNQVLNMLTMHLQRHLNQVLNMLPLHLQLHLSQVIFVNFFFKFINPSWCIIFSSQMWTNLYYL